MAMKIYGHPWSINTRKSLMTLAEKELEAELVLVMIPWGEQKQPAHVARHPWGKVPVLDDDGFVLYETRAINAYLDRKRGPATLVPSDTREAAWVDQWINTADSYFIPAAHPMIVELLFRPYLGGERNDEVIAAGRDGMQLALDTADRWLADRPYLAGSSFSLADIHWMPYLEYLTRIGEGDSIERRRNLARWWTHISARPTWKKVARSGPQPYESGMTAETIAKQYRR
jgi:glutathione S-transferase